jgi:outer membrane beta-barrel protein
MFKNCQRWELNMFILKKISWFSLFLFFVTSVASVAIASEKSLYDFSWLDKDKEIYVLQNRSFRKDGKLFVALNVGETVAKAYVEGMVGQARIGYFFKEDFGIEILTSKNDGKFNDLASKVISQGAVPYSRIIDSYNAAQLLWSPFYSKINTFNKIFYYDWMFGLGYASITNSDNRNEFKAGESRTTLTEETNSGLIWSTGLRFYITPSWSARIDFTALRYEADFFVKDGTTFKSGGKEWFNNYDLTLGVNYTF